MKRPRTIVHFKDNQTTQIWGSYACTVKPHICTIHRSQARSVVAMLVVAVTETSLNVVA